MKSLIAAAVATVIFSSSAALAIDSGDYYEGVNRNDPAPTLNLKSNSFGYPGAMSHLMGSAVVGSTHVDEGDYYEGVNRPN